MAESEDLRAVRRALGQQLARYRRAAGLSQHQLAPRIHYGRSTVANVEVGRQNVPRDFWERVDACLRAGGALLQGHDELQALAAQQRWEAAHHAMEAATASSDLAAALTGQPPGPAVTHSGRVDLVAVAGLRERVQQITAAYDTVPSVALLAAVGQCQAQVSSLRDRATTSLVRRELCGVEAAAAILTGQLVWDASQRRDHATALAHFDHAVAAARQVSDVLAEAHALLRKSYVALYGVRRPGVGLALAAQAARRSQGLSPTLTGVALLHVAEAHGLLGDRSGCEAALDEAQTHLARHDDVDAAADFFSPDQFGRLAGSCYLSLRLPDQAQAHLEQAARTMQDHQKVSAMVLGNLTLAYLRQRKLAEGMATLHTAIDEVERTRGGGGLNLIFAAGQELRPWRQQPAVQELHDRLLALMA